MNAHDSPQVRRKCGLQRTDIRTRRATERLRQALRSGGEAAYREEWYRIFGRYPADESGAASGPVADA